MSYDMSFWKQKTEIKKTNNEIYRILSGGEEIDGLCELPVSDIRNDFETVFKSWSISKNVFEKENQYFELMLKKQFVRVDCYGVEIQYLNAIIDIMLKYDCPFYDASIDTRFN